MPRAKPKSDVGAAMTRFNALRHGMTSSAPVIPGVESVEEWEAHRDAMVAGLAPPAHPLHRIQVLRPPRRVNGSL